MSLAKVNSVYNCGRTLTLIPHTISFPALGEFSVKLSQFIRSLGEDLEDPYWSDFIRPLKRYRFDLCAAPWPAHALQDFTRERQRQAAKHLLTCQQMFPSLTAPAESIIAKLEAVAECTQDPVLEGMQSIAERVSDGQRAAIVITESRLVGIAREAIATAPDYAQWPVFVPRNIRGLVTYDSLVVIGSPSWYRRAKYVFSAPRASSIHILCYDWMSVKWDPEPSLAAPIQGHSRGRHISITYTPTTPGVTDEEIIPPAADIDKVLREAESDSDSGNDHEPVTARLLVLEDDKGVFIEAEGDATFLAIDLSQEMKRRVRRIIHRNVEPGLYILLRTVGGGDYVVAVANRILGDRRKELREMQQKWKALLRLAVRKDGADRTIRALKDYGSQVASYQNLRNWMKDRTIATNDLEDFLAIMQVIGLRDESGQYWQAMRTIRRAHGKAGRRIRRQLLEQVNQSDLTELERVGFMEFALNDNGGGQLTAYRIKSVADRTVEVLPSLVDDPFDLEDL